MTKPVSLLQQSMACKCPKCHKGNLYKGGFSLDLADSCSECGLDFTKNDSADGPAVFLIFFLGFLLVPLALIVDVALSPPLWVHGVLWTVVTLGLTVGMLKPIKSYVIALQYKHRPGDWK
ncbi:MAG: DUF983 domain-containing protein [Alcanivorax sp.]